MALVTPLSAEHDPETQQLAEFFNETLEFKQDEDDFYKW